MRKSPELRESARSVSPAREAVQAAAREAAEQAIHLASENEDRKSPINDSGSPTRTETPDVKGGSHSAPPTSGSAIQSLLASLATNPSMQMFQQPQLLAAFATIAAMANNPAAPPVSMAAGLPGLFGAPTSIADQAQALQTFAQLQFLMNPATSGQMNMMPLQQVS